jgi:excinuclease UvrABC nuclease subunit
MSEQIFEQIRDLVSGKECIEIRSAQVKTLFGIGVYLFSVEDRAVYVGASKSMLHRAFYRNHHKHSQIPDNADVTFFPCETIENANRLETLLIDTLQPTLNERKYRKESLDMLRQSLGQVNVNAYRNVLKSMDE